MPLLAGLRAQLARQAVCRSRGPGPLRGGQTCWRPYTVAAPCGLWAPRSPHLFLCRPAVSTRPFSTAPPNGPSPSSASPAPPSSPPSPSPSTTPSQIIDESRTKEDRSAVSVNSIVKTVARHLWPPDEPGLRMRVVASISFLFLGKAFNMVIPFLYKAIVDGLSTGATGTFLGLGCASVVLVYGVARLGASATQELRNTVFIQVSQTALRKIATQVYAHIHNLDLNFHLNRKTGALTNVIERGTKGIGTVLSTVLFSIFPTFLELGMVCVVLYYSVGWQFALVSFGTVMVYMVFTTKVTTWRTAFRRRMNDMERRATQHAVDGLLNYESVKYFGNEQHEVRRYNDYMDKYSRSAVAVQESLSFLNFGQQLIFTTALTYMMYLAAMGVIGGTLTVGDLVMINILLFQLSVPLNFLGGVYRELTQAVTDMENMFGVLNQKPLVVDREDAIDFVFLGGRVEFRNVSFSYVPEKRLLQGLSFTVEPGTTVAFVGTSGCGKSTILRLLYRFYDVQEGQVLLDGQDVRDVKVASLRRHMGVVPQDTVLFNDTIRYNIHYGNLEASDEEVRHAADMAALTRAVAHMPKQLDTMVGERGLKLSGGEKQRVALARVFLKNPRILMCDEATSALDSGTEASIMQSLSDIRQQDTTTLVIAHRLSTIQNADKIVVLHEGRAVEQGTHFELLAQRGVYYSLWSTQQHLEDVPLPRRGETACDAPADHPHEEPTLEEPAHH